MADTVFTSDKGAIPLEFSVNPSYPGAAIMSSGIARGVSEGGEVYSYLKGRPYVLLALAFKGMPSSDFDDGFDYASGTQKGGTQSLVNWFYNVAGGSGTFTYRDAFGNSHLVCINDDVLEFSLVDQGMYDCTITLKETVG